MPNVVAPALGPYVELQSSPGGVIFDATFDGRRRGFNKAAVGLAAKHARFLWALPGSGTLCHGMEHRPQRRQKTRFSRLTLQIP